MFVYQYYIVVPQHECACVKIVNTRDYSKSTQLLFPQTTATKQPKKRDKPVTREEKASKTPKKGTAHPIIVGREEIADDSALFYQVRSFATGKTQTSTPPRHLSNWNQSEHIYSTCIYPLPLYCGVTRVWYMINITCRKWLSNARTLSCQSYSKLRNYFWRET